MPLERVLARKSPPAVRTRERLRTLMQDLEVALEVVRARETGKTFRASELRCRSVR